ncbi:MAG: NADH-quinone oxidoreductase subunit NuoH [Chloroflexi bacterium]|nr:NADH-quinone oxidoreductase subunit NuoH [Chloroflexota bacterium]
MNILGISVDPAIVKFIILVVQCIVWIVALLTTFAYIQLVERWTIARIQVRIGPNRTGPRGLLQPLADAIKALFKEELVPTNADKLVFVLAPMISVSCALLAFAVIPVAPPINLFGVEIPMQIADVDVGVLYILAIGSVSVYGTVLAGWSSNNKYSLLGSLRAAAQLISYEVTLGLALVGVFMLTSTLSLNGIVDYQKNFGWLIAPQIIGFFLYVIASIAETNRLPFDLPEAETELIAGYYTEYSSIKFAFFFMAEYINIITVCAVTTTLFLGGFLSPLSGIPFLRDIPILAWDGIWWFALKVFVLIFIFMWIRGTFPRLRYDQLMNFTWKAMLPAALLNILITAGIVLYPEILRLLNGQVTLR